MNERPQTFWTNWKRNAKNRLISGLIALPIITLWLVFKIPYRVIEWIIGGALSVVGIYVLWQFIQLRRWSRVADSPATAALEQAKASEWKRKMQSLADSTDMTRCDMTFEEFCDNYDDDFLTMIFQELQKMPVGSRILHKAYEIVCQRISKP